MARTYLVFGDIDGKRFVRNPTHETVRTAAEHGHPARREWNERFKSSSVAHRQ
jgi:hypothetical protein